MTRTDDVTRRSCHLVLHDQMSGVTLTTSLTRWPASLIASLMTSLNEESPPRLTLPRPAYLFAGHGGDYLLGAGGLRGPSLDPQVYQRYAERPGGGQARPSF